MLHLIMVLAALAAAASNAPQAKPGGSPRILFLTAGPVAQETTLRFVEGGTAAAPVPWPADDIAWYFLRSDGYQENHDRIAPGKVGDPAVTVTPAATGVTMAGVDFRQTVATQTAVELRAWLREQGFAIAADSLATLADEQPVRIRWRISAKTLLRTPGDAAPEPSEIAMSKSGQQAEIRLWADGTLAAAGDDVPLKLYADGDKLPSVDVIGWVSGEAIAPLIADQAGVVNLTVTAGGEWRLAAAGVRLLNDDAAADAEVFVATVTFENRAKGGAR